MSFVSLARLAAVSQPAPYRHFADRKALLEAVTTEGFEEFAAALTAAASRRAGRRSKGDGYFWLGMIPGALLGSWPTMQSIMRDPEVKAAYQRSQNHPELF